MKTIPPEILSSLQSWDFWATTLYITFVFLAITGTVCSIVVAMFVDKLSVTKTRILAAGGAVSLGLITAFSLGDRSNQIRRSWRTLNATMIEYRDGTNCTFEALIDVYRATGDVASLLPFTPPSKDPPSTPQTR